MPESLRVEAAKLAAEAMSALYEPVGDEVIGVLASEFLIEGSELGEAAALVDSGVQGLIAAYPAHEYQNRQRISLHHALGNLSAPAAQRLIRQLRVLAEQIPRERLKGEYIARFAVRADARGSGVADKLMALFLAEHPSASLHVRAANERAIRFYRRHGFELGGRGEFLLMWRSTGGER
jgi:GNAT superfamily N-acetyltransferase